LSSISFQVNAGSSHAISASQVFINPGYTGNSTGNVPGDPTHHGDLAIIKLSTAVSADVPFYDLYTGDLQSKVLTFVSYAGSTTVKKTGENRADLLFADAAGTPQTYLFDYDGPDLSTNRIGADITPNGTLGVDREASFVSGDSGSSAFVYVNRRWQLAGVNTFEVKFSEGPTTSGAYGTGGGGIALSAYSSWINSVILAPVPEPETYAMLLAGLGLIGAVARRRKTA
jgi:hypothetical protein